MEKILTIVGYISIVLGLIISGALVSGYQQRSSYNNETLEDRMKRLKLGGILVLIGVASFILRYLIYSLD